MSMIMLTYMPYRPIYNLSQITDSTALYPIHLFWDLV